MKRAKSYDEIRPLIALIKEGKLFDVQAWIAAGKPVNPPRPPQKGPWARPPLKYAIDTGFHSLVEVLLKAGAEIETSRFSALDHALWGRHCEIAKLLVEHGANVQDTDMSAVFYTWQPDLMEFFIARGADVETDNPLADALCQRIRTALGTLRKHKDRFPSFQEQANIALRHHCKKGSLKWVSLMLWAGADPHTPGPCDPEDKSDPDGDYNALEWAAFYGHFDIFGIRSIRLDPKSERSHHLMRTACYGEDIRLLKHLLDLGFSVNDREDGSSSYIDNLLSGMDWCFFEVRKNLDTEKTREQLKMLHLLVSRGARWIPQDRYSLNRIRRSLMALKPDYTVEIVWIMAKYGGCDRTVVEELVKTPAMCGHVAAHGVRITQLVARLPAHDDQRWPPA